MGLKRCYLGLKLSYMGLKLRYMGLKLTYLGLKPKVKTINTKFGKITEEEEEGEEKPLLEARARLRRRALKNSLKSNYLSSMHYTV